MLVLTNKNRRFLNSFYKPFQAQWFMQNTNLMPLDFKFFLCKRLNEHKPEPKNYIQNNQLAKNAFEIDIPCAVILRYLSSTKNRFYKTCNLQFCTNCSTFYNKKTAKFPLQFVVYSKVSSTFSKARIPCSIVSPPCK